MGNQPSSIKEEIMQKMKRRFDHLHDERDSDKMMTGEEGHKMIPRQ